MKTIFIAGSVRKDIPKKYIQEGKKLAKYILKTDYKVCCCADEGGIIGNIYSCLKHERERLFFAVPQVYMPATKNIKEKIDVITNTINERTDVLIKQANINLILPGGIGTLYELLSLIETKRAGEHNKEIIIVNTDGFFDSVLEMFEKLFKEKFAEVENKKTYNIVNNIEEAIRYLEERRN